MALGSGQAVIRRSDGPAQPGAPPAAPRSVRESLGSAALGSVSWLSGRGGGVRQAWLSWPLSCLPACLPPPRYWLAAGGPQLPGIARSD